MARTARGMLSSRMYSASPTGLDPRTSSARKSAIHTVSSSSTPTAVMLAGSGWRVHNPSTMAKSAMSENHRKFEGPYSRQ
jgi:hypothetical protein